jgi:hypothetical protein
MAITFAVDDPALLVVVLDVELVVLTPPQPATSSVPATKIETM